MVPGWLGITPIRSGEPSGPGVTAKRAHLPAHEWEKTRGLVPEFDIMAANNTISKNDEYLHSEFHIANVSNETVRKREIS